MSPTAAATVGPEPEVDEPALSCLSTMSKRSGTHQRVATNEARRSRCLTWLTPAARPQVQQTTLVMGPTQLWSNQQTATLLLLPWKAVKAICQLGPVLAVSLCPLSE